MSLNRLYPVLSLVVASIGSTGCFSSVTLVKLRPDGSGTIELTTTVRKAAIAKLDEMAPGDATSTTRTAEHWFPERSAHEVASKLGASVHLISTRKLDTADVLGRMTTYTFGDIRQLTLDMIPLLPAAGSGGASARFVGESHFAFELFDESDYRVFVARFPDAQIEYADADIPSRMESTDPEQQALMRTLLGGGGLDISIQFEDAIRRTNTPHRTGQRVTLLALDAERLLLDPAVSKRILVRPASLDELRFHLHDAPGVTVSLHREIRVELAVP